MTIHSTDPFATPESERSPVRRWRGRLASAVTLWTAPGPAGLTVSSTLIADGQPPRVLGLIDPESEVWGAIEAHERFAVTSLRAEDQRLADKFAGVMPAPGGPFSGYSWQQTEFGPVLAEASGWVGCRLESAREYGWGLLVEGQIERVELSTDDGSPLLYYRGRYRRLADQ